MSCTYLFQGMNKKEIVALFYQLVMKPVQSACNSIRRIGKTLQTALMSLL